VVDRVVLALGNGLCTAGCDSVGGRAVTRGAREPQAATSTSAPLTSARRIVMPERNGLIPESGTAERVARLGILATQSAILSRKSVKLPLVVAE
jgi:hypothetical protein